MPTLIERKYLHISWRTGSPRPDGRKYRFRHNPRPSNFYVQVGPFEMVLWYR